MSVLSLSVTQRTISASDLSQIFSGAQNIDSIQVTFDSEWTGFTKKAVFTSTKEDCFFVALDSSNTAKIPATVLENSGTILIGDGRERRSKNYFLSAALQSRKRSNYN